MDYCLQCNNRGGDRTGIDSSIIDLSFSLENNWNLATKQEKKITNQGAEVFSYMPSLDVSKRNKNRTVHFKIEEAYVITYKFFFLNNFIYLVSSYVCLFMICCRGVASYLFFITLSMSSHRSK